MEQRKDFVMIRFAITILGLITISSTVFAGYASINDDLGPSPVLSAAIFGGTVTVITVNGNINVPVQQLNAAGIDSMNLVRGLRSDKNLYFKCFGEKTPGTNPPSFKCTGGGNSIFVQIK
jgi:hypothetical protein